ncbi:MAG: type II toxin-antitoxin system RelE/ParE family toxin [Pseudomonadota bacterium]
MEIISVNHKGLKDFLERNDTSGLKQSQVSRLRNILAALVAAPDIEGLIGPPGWRIHQLKGDRKGEWSISVTGNWRLTFSIKGANIVNLNLEDYH